MTVAISERESIQTSPFRYPGSVLIVAFCTALATGHTAAAYHEADLEALRGGTTRPAMDLSGAELEDCLLTPGCVLKGAILTEADMARVALATLGTVDLYNATVFGGTGDARLAAPFYEVRERYPLLGVPGRLTSITIKTPGEGEEVVDVTSLTLQDLPALTEAVGENPDDADPVTLFKAAYVVESFCAAEEESLAFKYYKIAACKGLVEAKNNMAWMLENNRPVEEGGLWQPHQRLLRARGYYETGAQAHPYLQFNYTRMVAYTEEDAEQAAVAQYSLARYYEEGRVVPPHAPEMAYWFLKAAQGGYTKAMYHVAVCYNRGWGLARDDGAYLRWMGQAAERGNIDACYDLGCYYRGSRPPNPSEALAWLEKAAEGEHKHALLDMAYIYETGEAGVPAYDKALSYYDHVACWGDNGQSTAHFNAGRMYSHLPQTLLHQRKALEHFEAAGPENPGALFMLGTYYERGIGIEQDTERAIDLYRQAAALGEDAAVLKLIFSDEQWLARLVRQEGSLLTAHLVNLFAVMDQLKHGMTQRVSQEVSAEERRVIEDHIGRMEVAEVYTIMNPVAIASAKGWAITVRSLVEGGEPVNQQLSTGFTPLMLASLFGHEDTVRQLLRLNAATLVRANPDYGAGTARQYAELGGYQTIAQLLREAEGETVQELSSLDLALQEIENLKRMMAALDNRVGYQNLLVEDLCIQSSSTWGSSI